MDLTEYLDAEWKPALGCTEPAAVAHAASLAAAQGAGAIRGVRLVVDPRTYKNCHAVGLPNSGGRTGILWALALGACLPDPSLGLGCFAAVDAAVLAAAADLIAREAIRVEVDPSRAELHIGCTVDRERAARAGPCWKWSTPTWPGWRRSACWWAAARSGSGAEGAPSVRATVGAMGLQELRKLAATLSEEDRQRLRDGAAFNLAMAEHGVSLLPAGFVPPPGQDPMARLSRLVAAGVFARMSGEPLMVMSLAGSGNKGITVSVPVTPGAGPAAMPRPASTRPWPSAVW